MSEQLSSAAARELVIGAVGCASVSGKEGPVASYLSNWMAQHGFAAHVDGAGNAVGTRGRGPLQVMLLGHIDTVPGHIPVHVDQTQTLHGRGSVDAKGSFCTFVAAVAGLNDEALAAATFTCVGATEEEASSSKGARFAAQQYKPDMVLIGEPSGWEGLTLGYKGRLIAKVNVTKDNFHSAGEGSSAADDLAESWQRVKSWAQARSAEGVFGGVQATIQHLETTSDGLQQVAGGTFGLRLPLHLPPEAARRELSDLFTGLPLSVTFSGDEQAVRHDKDSVLARALRVAIRQAGGTPVFKLKTGTSDMNVVYPYWPVPTLAYGPGDSNLDHTPHERLSLTEYDQAVSVLLNALQRAVTVKP